MNRKWSDEERNFIKTNAGTMKDRDIALELAKHTDRKISVQSVRKQRNKMGIVKKKGRGCCQIISISTKESQND